jgi:hypothetical protein
MNRKTIKIDLLQMEIKTPIKLQKAAQLIAHGKIDWTGYLL